eukprot:Rmarinus@m.24311
MDRSDRSPDRRDRFRSEKRSPPYRRHRDRGYDRGHGGYDRDRGFGYGKRRGPRDDFGPPPPRKRLREDELFAGPLMSFEEYMQSQFDQCDDPQVAYDLYVKEHQRQRCKTFFEAHKDEEWFQEKYLPELESERREKLKQHAKVAVETFRKELDYGTYQCCLEYKESEWQGKGEEHDFYGDASAAEAEKCREKKGSGKKVEETEGSEPENGAEGNSGSTERDNGDRAGSADGTSSDEERDEERHGAATPSGQPVKRSRVVTLKDIPPAVSKAAVREVLNTTPGIQAIRFGDPQSKKQFCRSVYVLYETSDEAAAALDSLGPQVSFENEKVDVELCTKREGTPRLLPPEYMLTFPITNEPERIEKDTENCQALIALLDKEREVETPDNLLTYSPPDSVLENDYGNADDAARARAKLDRLLNYLRRVHLMCYYSALEEHADEAGLQLSCGKTVLRAKKFAAAESEGEDSAIEAEEVRKEKNRGDERKGPKGRRATTEEERWKKWAHRLDQKVERRLQSTFRCGVVKNEQDVVGAVLKDNMLIRHNKAGELRVRCNFCEKVFEGVAFVEKHLRNKHDEKMKSKIEETKANLYFNNYCNDPKRPTEDRGRTAGGAKARGVHPPSADAPAPLMPLPHMPYPYPPPPMMMPGYGAPPPWMMMPLPPGLQDPRARNQRRYHDLDAPEDDTEEAIDAFRHVDYSDL